MTEAPQPADRVEAALARLLEMDLAAAEHVHAQLLATTEPKAVAEVSRAYQRASRALRQTIMLRMKFDKDRTEAVARAARDEPTLISEPSAFDRLADLRTADLQDAVGRVAAAAYPDKPRLQREALDRLDYEIDLWVNADDDAFIVERLHDLVLEASSRCGLPMALANQWEDLPPPLQSFDPAVTTPISKADTG